MKTCKASKCAYPVFGGEYCQRHQWLRTDKKPKKLKYRANKERAIGDVSFGYSSQLEMFKDKYWKIEKPIICPISHIPIGDIINAPISLFVTHCAHILPKGSYPLWKLNPANIMIINPNVHRILDQGTLDEREKYPDYDWDLWDRAKEKAKIDYQIFVKENNL